jgi:DNA relaxase NicK
VTQLARQLYRDVGQAPSRNGRPPTRTLIRDSDGGQTVYIGRRVSENMGRLYDKGVESATNAPGTRWRYEVEYKGDQAWNAVQALLPVEEEARCVSSTVAQWFSSRGGRVWRHDSLLAVRNWGPKETSTDKQLQWLARGVRPTVVALIDRLGYHRVTTALGLGARSTDP